MDWNVIGADVVTKLLPVVVLITVYYVRAIVPQVAPIFINIAALLLMEASTLLNSFYQDGTWNPVQAALLTGLVTLIAEVLKNLGAAETVKKILLIKGQ